tara:strand:+ start:1418 stop:2176 length:759 start_codon:yes stop_codon:yes gene_type:complete
MVNWLALIILIFLISSYLCVAKRAILESFTNNTGHLEFKEDLCSDSDSSSDEDSESDEESESPVILDNKDSSVSSHESRVDDTIIIKDTIHKNSKVGSSLNFTYIDENCEKVVDYDTKPEFPVEEVQSSPITPIVNVNNNFPSWEKSACKVSGPAGKTHKFANEEKFHSEMFDDTGLKPKPQLDSPYGFVYFPNKYWKQWQTKAPVCTPTSKCNVLPTYTQGTPVDVLDYTQIGSLMPKFEYQEEYEKNTCQ